MDAVMMVVLGYAKGSSREHCGWCVFLSAYDVYGADIIDCGISYHDNCQYRMRIKVFLFISGFIL
jgi:hypothetical protein